MCQWWYIIQRARLSPFRHNNFWTVKFMFMKVDLGIVRLSSYAMHKNRLQSRLTAKFGISFLTKKQLLSIIDLARKDTFHAIMFQTVSVRCIFVWFESTKIAMRHNTAVKRQNHTPKNPLSFHSVSMCDYNIEGLQYNFRLTLDVHILFLAKLVDDANCVIWIKNEPTLLNSFVCKSHKFWFYVNKYDA